MNLREKFKSKVSINTTGEASRFAKQCETICDDFAIGFKRFCESYDFDETNPTKTDKELLQIYKDIQK